jgi:hypothetical protein
MGRRKEQTMNTGKWLPGLICGKGELKGERTGQKGAPRTSEMSRGWCRDQNSLEIQN